MSVPFNTLMPTFSEDVLRNIAGGWGIAHGGMSLTDLKTAVAKEAERRGGGGDLDEDTHLTVRKENPRILSLVVI